MCAAGMVRRRCLLSALTCVTGRNRKSQCHQLIMQGVEGKVFLMCVHGELSGCLCRQAPTAPSQEPSCSSDHLPKEGGESMEISNKGTFLSSVKGHDSLPSI